MSRLTMSRQLITIYAATAVVMLVLDALWLGVIATGWYRDALGPLMADPPRWGAALLFYALYPAGLVTWAVWPQRHTPGLRSAALQGALLGLFAYGTYDLTNLAVLRNWPLSLSVLDMAWGATVSALSAAAGKAWADRQPKA